MERILAHNEYFGVLWSIDYGKCPIPFVVVNGFGTTATCTSWQQGKKNPLLIHAAIEFALTTVSQPSRGNFLLFFFCTIVRSPHVALLFSFIFNLLYFTDIGNSCRVLQRDICTIRRVTGSRPKDERSNVRQYQKTQYWPTRQPRHYQYQHQHPARRGSCDARETTFQNDGSLNEATYIDWIAAYYPAQQYRQSAHRAALEHRKTTN